MLACHWHWRDGTRRRTGSETDVVEGELADSGVELEEQRQGLANATGGTENGDLGGLQDDVSMGNANWVSVSDDGRPLFKSEAVGMVVVVVGAIELRTWRADAAKPRRWTWENICLAENIVPVMSSSEMEDGACWSGGDGRGRQSGRIQAGVFSDRHRRQDVHAPFPTSGFALATSVSTRPSASAQLLHALRKLSSDPYHGI